MNRALKLDTVTPIEIGNAFLNRHATDRGISHMKLQKLSYLFHGYWLQENHDLALLKGPEVWQFGSVFGPLYRAFKRFKSENIPGPATKFFDFGVPAIATDKRHLTLIDRIWRRYGRLSGIQLSNLTHRIGSPWHIMAKRYDFRVPRGLEIEEALIRNHYRRCVPRLPA